MNRRNRLLAVLAAGSLLAAAASPPAAARPPAIGPEAPSSRNPMAQANDRAPLDGTEWQLSGWDGADLPDWQAPDAEVTLAFQDGRIAGRSACNRYMGGYAIDGDTFTLSGPLASTRMACPEPQMTVEQAYLAALQSAQSYRLTDGGQLEIRYGGERSASGVLKFSPRLGSAAGGPPQATATQRLLFVGPQRVPCTGVGLRECFQVRGSESDDWELFYSAIAGFEYEPGFAYLLQVRETPVANPPADSSSIRTELVNVLQKTPVPPARDCEAQS